jgi:hypothetical protein|tara:strand:- start:3217 stop:3642 length:426 start_codon:yes stop_codon:yes gene_type:complete
MDIKEQLNQIHIEIKLLGLNVKYNKVEEDQLESHLSQLNELEKKKKMLEKKYELFVDKKEKPNSLEELSLKQSLNHGLGGIPDGDLREKIENHISYLTIYNEKYDIIKKSLKINKIHSLDQMPYYMRELKYENINYTLTHM